MVNWRRSSLWWCMIQSRMWPWECIGWWTAWSRSNIWRRSYILTVAGESARSKWMLKSPKMRRLTFNWLQSSSMSGNWSENIVYSSCWVWVIQMEKMNSTLGNNFLKFFFFNRGFEILFKLRCPSLSQQPQHYQSFRNKQGARIQSSSSQILYLFGKLWRWTIVGKHIHFTVFCFCVGLNF